MAEKADIFGLTIPKIRINLINKREVGRERLKYCNTELLFFWIDLLT